MTKTRYTVPVTSNKGVIGFSSPMERGPKPQHRTWSAAFSFVPPVLAARVGGRKPCRFRSAFPGLLTRSSRRPRLAAGVTVITNRNVRSAS